MRVVGLYYHSELVKNDVVNSQDEIFHVDDV